MNGLELKAADKPGSDATIANSLERTKQCHSSTFAPAGFELKFVLKKPKGTIPDSVRTGDLSRIGLGLLRPIFLSFSDCFGGLGGDDPVPASVRNAVKMRRILRVLRPCLDTSRRRRERATRSSLRRKCVRRDRLRHRCAVSVGLILLGRSNCHRPIC